jgi:TPR repeat protein
VLGGNQIEEAVRQYELAVRAGYSSAASGLGQFLIRHADEVDRADVVAQALVDFAETGDANARLAVADLKLNGVALERDVPAAMGMLLELAETEDARAIYRLGVINETGVHVPQDYAAAARYFEAALGLEYGRAGLHLAELYEYGNGVEKDVDRARQILEALTETGDPSAAYQLGGLLERQDPSGITPPESMRLYRESASTGYEPSRLRMARIYIEGRSVEQDVDLGIRIIEQLSTESYGPATTQLGDLYRDGDFKRQDFGRALSLYRLGLNQGHDQAELRIAGLLRDGSGVPQDLEGARAIYAKYATIGNISAAYGLARVMEMQAQSKVISEEALAWYEYAARARHDGARLRMAELYIEGNGVEPDIDQALSLLNTLDQESEYASATRTLGDLYRDGEHVDEDHPKAVALYQRAIDLGDESSKLRLADLYAKGSPEVLNFEAAAKLYQELMDGGSVSAIYKLARLHEQRLPKDKVTPQIVEWYRKAAEQRYPPAMMRLADLRLEGSGVAQDVDSAMALYHDLASTGLGAATYRLAKVREYGEEYLSEYEESFALYRQAVEQGYSEAELQMGRLYGQAKSALGDVDRAREILRKFADNDSARAAIELGNLYVDRGEEIAADWQDNAAKWYQRAADLGSSDAMYDLVRLFESISRAPTEKSMKLLREAANSGHGRAMLDLGRRMFRGDYLDRDPVEGLALVLASGRLQTTNAMEAAVELMGVLDDPTVIDKAEVRAEALYQEYFGAPRGVPEDDEDEESDAESGDG